MPLIFNISNLNAFKVSCLKTDSIAIKFNFESYSL